MDPITYVVAAAVVVILLIAVGFLRKNKTDGGNDIQGEAPREEAGLQRRAAPNVGQARRRGARNRLRDRQDDSEEEDEQEQFEHVTLPSGKIGTKKMKKLQEKEERLRQREMDQEEREERKKREEQLEELRKKKSEKEAAEEAAREAEEQALKEQKEKEEYEEYLKLKEHFSVEEEGTDATELHQDTESLLQQFIDYIKEMKVVMLEDLATHFKLKTQDVIDRIKDLQAEERLSGVLDDRGKFIYITQQEYEAVAKFIKQRGRVSITELAESSNKLINLNPDNQSTHAKLVTEVS